MYLEHGASVQNNRSKLLQKTFVNNKTSIDKHSTRPKDATYDHILKYIGLLGSVQGLKMLVQLIRNKLTSILLHSDGMGVSAQLANISELVFNATNLGLSFGTVRNLSELFEEGTEEERIAFVRVIRTWAFWTAILGAAICFLLSFAFCDWYFDDDNSFIPTICLLSIFVFTMPLEAIECSIVKGMRRLKSLAYIETSVVFGSFILTIPLYYFLGVKGIVVSLILTGIFTLAVHLMVTTRMFPWRIDKFNKDTFIKGIPLLKMGIPYVVAGIAGAMSTSFIYGALESLKEVGLYRQGYLMLTMSSIVVFSAMDSDYFPRLSSANHDISRMNNMANKQIQVNILLMTPILILMSLFMSRLINFLAAKEFIQIAPMVIIATFYLFFRGVTLPIAYFPLAKGNSLVYMVAEVLYDVVVAALIYFGYKFANQYLSLIFDGIQCGGLVGTGIALSLSALFDLVMLTCIYGFIYGMRLQRRTIILIISEAFCLGATLPYCVMTNVPLQKYSIGLVTLLLSLFLAWKLLSRESGFILKLRRKLFGKSDKCECCK